MINVVCKVKNEGERGSKEIEVRSITSNVGEPRGMVELKVDSAIVRVFGDDLIQAVENCMSNGRRQWRGFIPTGSRSQREEDEE